MYVQRICIRNMFYKWLIGYENFSALTLSKPTASAGFPTILNVIFRISTNTKNMKQMRKFLAFLVFFLFEYLFYLFSHLFCRILCADMSMHPYTSEWVYAIMQFHLYLFSILCNSAKIALLPPSILWLLSPLAARNSSSSSSTPLARASAPIVAFWQPVIHAASNVACVGLLQMFLLFEVFCKCCKFLYRSLLFSIVIQAQRISCSYLAVNGPNWQCLKSYNLI